MNKDALEPWYYVDEIKDMASAICVAGTDRMLEWLEGEGTTVERSPGTRMGCL